ncbi:GNAT family N-acetyltransferase [Streptomyces zhihengii]|uniref:GNAT family N-acetyltransferase n=1 Tax=Streptomyces zhihengii TaxID=1818004 RepID=UPI0036BB75D0
MAAPTGVTVRRLTAEALPAAAEGLGALLADAVDDGASVGFLAPLAIDRAAAYWSGLAPALADGTVTVWTAHADNGGGNDGKRHADDDGTGTSTGTGTGTSSGGRLIGTVQLRSETSPNGTHRAEVAKLLVHRDARGRGVARLLLTAAEECARDAGRTLLLLDTQTGSAAEHLYRSAGWTPVGTVPDYAADPVGVLRPTTFFHKTLGGPAGSD